MRGICSSRCTRDLGHDLTCRRQAVRRTKTTVLSIDVEERGGMGISARSASGQHSSDGVHSLPPSAEQQPPRAVAIRGGPLAKAIGGVVLGIDANEHYAWPPRDG